MTTWDEYGWMRFSYCSNWRTHRRKHTEEEATKTVGIPQAMVSHWGCCCWEDKDLCRRRWLPARWTSLGRGGIALPIHTPITTSGILFFGTQKCTNMTDSTHFFGDEFINMGKWLEVPEEVIALLIWTNCTRPRGHSARLIALDAGMRETTHHFASLDHLSSDAYFTFVLCQILLYFTRCDP